MKPPLNPNLQLKGNSIPLSKSKLRQNIAPMCPVESQYCDYKKGLTAKHMRLPYVPIIREFYYSKKSYLPTCGVLQILEWRTEKWNWCITYLTKTKIDDFLLIKLVYTTGSNNKAKIALSYVYLLWIVFELCGLLRISEI